MSNKFSSDPRVIEDVVRRYQAGESANAIGRSYGRSPALITYILKRQRIEINSKPNALFKSQAALQSVIDRYEQGESAHSIGKTLGVKTGTITRILKRTGVDVDPRRHVVFKNKVERQKVADRYAAGESAASLAEEYGCDEATIRNLLRRLSVPLRDAGGQLALTDEQVDQVVHMYQNGLSQADIAISFGVGQRTVSAYLRRQGVKMRSLGSRSGDEHPRWNGGRIDAGSYIGIMVNADSPFASMRQLAGYVLEHRLIMAQYLGRPLERWETVHHINGKHHDNRIENLQLRIGAHGKGIAYRCMDCGSNRIEPVKIKG